MIQLFDVNEQNWLDIVSLRVSEKQRQFLDQPVGIVARGYAYRSCSAKVIGISDGRQAVGAALVRDLDEAPACYDLQQFLIDERFQNRGYGTEALRLILSQLSKEGKYRQVEVCVNRRNAPALLMCKKAGFVDTGYIDETVPDCCNLMYCFRQGDNLCTDSMTSDFSDPLFQEAFKQYFSELGCSVSDWDGLFKEMNDEGGNAAIVRTAADHSVIGFIQLRPITFTSWFFEETCGFIREFWVAGAFRNQQHGSGLIRLAEDYFVQNGIYTSILTTDTAAHFYEKHGYRRAPGCRAKNQDAVYVKHLNSN